MNRNPSPPFNWTLDQTKRLITILQTNRRLWDKKDPEFKDIGNKRGLQEIIELLNTPKMSVKQLQGKLRNLQNTYKLEMRKILVAKKKGFFYRPTLPWFRDYYHVMKEVKEPEIYPEESDSGEDIQYNSEENTANSDTYVVTISQECLEDIARGNNSNIDFDEQPVLRKSKIDIPGETYVKDEIDIQQDDSYMEEPPMDEFQMFADHIAEQLRLMSFQKAHKVLKDIESMFDNVTVVQIYED